MTNTLDNQNTPDEIDDFVEELLAQPPALVTHDELADYKQRAEALITAARIETLESLEPLKEVDNTYSTDTKILYNVAWEAIVSERNKLKATLTNDKIGGGLEEDSDEK